MPRSLSPILITLDRVGDRAQHNAFTDLLFYQDTFYLVYRESDSHQRGRNGVIRFMTSPDGAVWKSEMVLEWEGIDLRDPKLSVTPGGKLMVLTEGIERDRQGQLVKVTSFVFMRDKEGRFEPFSLDIEPGNILWQITWHQGKAWGVSYPVKKDQDLILWSTLDGIHYSEESRLPLEGKATEAAVHFMPDGRLALLVRRDASGTTSALWGLAPFPYKKWQWQPAGYYLGGPNFIVLPNESIWAAGRIIYYTPYGGVAKTALLKWENTRFIRKLILPSFGDTSYPGMIFHQGFLWMSYYSEHEEKAVVYIAKILLP